MTLIEVIVYMALLSMLLIGIISFVWASHMSDMELSGDMQSAYGH